MALEPMDYEQIRQVLAMYCHSLDFQDLDTFVEVFAPDGTFEAISDQESLTGKHTGRDELRVFGASVGEYTEGHVRHSSLSVLIDGDGDTAYSTSYCLVTRDFGMPHGKNQTPSGRIETSGVYVDQLSKIDGRWYIQKRTFRYDGYPELMARVGKPIDFTRSLGE
jgi:ketosteroid isomerase-like protein